MPVPKQKHTKSRRNQRRSHLALKPRNFSVCLKCGKSVFSHHACPNCGYYRGREVINVLAKLEKKEKKLKQKEIQQAEKEKAVEEKKSLTMEKLSK